MRVFHLGLPLVVLILYSNLVIARDQTGDLFSKSLLSKVQITKVDNYQKDVSNLSSTDKLQLLSAKKVFSDFLVGLQKGDASALEELTPELRKKYSNVHDLFNDRFRSDALLSFQIFDFNILKSKNEIEFRYFLSEITEGTICAYQRSVVLRNVDGSWKIANFGFFR